MAAGQRNEIIAVKTVGSLVSEPFDGAKRLPAAG
jgi:hypothetical protein